MRKLFLLCCLFILLSCKTTKKSNSELYVSGYMNEDFNVPGDLFLGFIKDSVFVINKESNVLLKFKTPKNKTDTLVFDTNKTTVLKTKSNAKIHHFKDNNLAFEAFLFHVKEEKNKDSLEFINNVNHKTFQTEIKKVPTTPNSDLKIFKQLKFNYKEVSITYDYYFADELMYSEYETHKYEIIKIKKSLFLQILNNDTYSNRIYEIIKLKSNQFTLVHYAETKTIFENYKLVNSSEEKSNYYKTCTNYRPYEYYNFESEKRYSKGNNHLLNKIKQNAPLTKGNGYITIHFTLNCKDEIGRFGLEQMDMNYNATKFDKELIKHLITEISKIDDWNSKTKSETDVHSFLMFKIENGKIIDLCP